jgi:hypothetical protein
MLKFLGNMFRLRLRIFSWAKWKLFLVKKTKFVALLNTNGHFMFKLLYRSKTFDFAHIVLKRVVWYPEHTAVIALNCFNWLVLIRGTRASLLRAETEFPKRLFRMNTFFKGTLRCEMGRLCLCHIFLEYLNKITKLSYHSLQLRNLLS